MPGSKQVGVGGFLLSRLPVLLRSSRIVAQAERAVVASPVSSGRNRIPYQTGNTGGMLGVTDRYGNITIQEGLSGRVLTETVRHEGVHRFLSPRNTGPINRFRADLGMAAYSRSHLLRYIEEAAAETVGTGNLLKGLRFPLQNDYGLSRSRLLLEAAGYFGVTAGGAYLGYELTDGE